MTGPRWVEKAPARAPKHQPSFPWSLSASARPRFCALNGRREDTAVEPVFGTRLSISDIVQQASARSDMAHPLTSRCAGPSRTPSSLVRTEPDDLYGSKDPGRGQRRTASQEKVWDGLRPREKKRGMAARGRKAYWQWPPRTDRHWDCGGGARADRIQKQIPKNTVQGRIRVKKLGFFKKAYAGAYRSSTAAAMLAGNVMSRRRKRE